MDDHISYERRRHADTLKGRVLARIRKGAADNLDEIRCCLRDALDGWVTLAPAEISAIKLRLNTRKEFHDANAQRRRSRYH